MNAPIDLGRVTDLTRYPVKSMAGTPLDSAPLGWHGIEGDRRFAFRRVGEQGDFPWLTASKLPALILYRPEGFEETDGVPLPTQVRTPAGARFSLNGPELAAELSGRFGNPVELMHLKQGIFDDASISVISRATIGGIGRAAGIEPDHRRFRPNIVVDIPRIESFLENEWVGKTLVFGDETHGPAVHVTARDPRCMMINLNPDTAEQDPLVLKTVVRHNQNDAGVYATVVRRGTIRVGDRVRLVTARG